MNKDIQLLNERLGQCLGFAVGTEPRFKWCYAPDVFYYQRDATSVAFTQRCWADRIGKVWMLCQWRLPMAYDMETGESVLLTEAQWWAKFQGERPYPANGDYVAHPETALPVGMLPDMGDTLAYIHSLNVQMSKDHAEHLSDVNAELAQAQDENQKEFFAEAEEWFPAFWSNGQGHVPGTKAHVSFGGV